MSLNEGKSNCFTKSTGPTKRRAKGTGSGVQRGTNLPKVGSYNRAVVLDAIQLSDGTTRVEIAERAGLTPQTVSGIVRRLLDEGLIREDGATPSTGGKPRTILRINAEAGYAVGIHFDPSRLSYVVADLAGRPVTRLRRSVPSDAEPADVAREMARTVRTLLGKARVPHGKVLGIGLGVPGPIDQERGTVFSPPQLSRWIEVPIKPMLEEATGLAVTVDNDATAAAIGERWAGAARAVANFAYLYLGTGIGGGLFLGHQVFRGSSANAAELGHISVAPDGPHCYCGNRGCMETLCNPAAIVAAAKARLAAGEPSSLDPVTLDHAAVCTAALAGDPAASAVIGTVAGYLADVMVSVVNLLDIELVVLGGHAAHGVGELYRDAIRRALETRPIARRMHTTAVELSPIGADAASIGAASLVFHAEFSPTLSTLLSSAPAGV
jgi:predicted NBD/HSP70 family sugar kinase